MKYFCECDHHIMTRHKTITPERYESQYVEEPVVHSGPRLSFYQRYSKIVSDSTLLCKLSANDVDIRA